MKFHLGSNMLPQKAVSLSPEMVNEQKNKIKRFICCCCFCCCCRDRCGKVDQSAKIGKGICRFLQFVSLLFWYALLFFFYQTAISLSCFLVYVLIHYSLLVVAWNNFISNFAQIIFTILFRWNTLLFCSL